MNMGHMYDTLNVEQKNVFERLINGENIFITGNAGTGKSYLVKAYNEYCTLNGIKLVKTAPTGVAANEIGGATLHHQFKLKVGLDFGKPDKYPKFLDNTDVLLIDEISMVRIDIFDKLMQILTLANNARKKKKKIQLILCGDFFQLAPVINKEEKPHLMDYYKCDIKGGYSFQSKYWNIYNVQLVNLTTVIRQEDEAFCYALDMCKTGNDRCLKFIGEHCAKNEISEAIWLCGKNATAAQKNEEGLNRLDGRLYTFFAEYDGEVTKNDKLCDDIFKFKIGAKIVMLVNEQSGLYQNGTVGKITNVVGEVITVELENGKTAYVERQEFTKSEYVNKMEEQVIVDANGNSTKKKVKTLKQKEIGSAKQFPMRLGYAVTIHKSQGQTYEKMNLTPEIFAVGQLYVALSRCKSIENIYISGYLAKRMVMTSKEVVDFYSNPDDYSFFEKDEEMETLFVPKKYAGRVKQLIQEWSAAM